MSEPSSMSPDSQPPAARFLRFEYTELPKLDARTPWAKLAARYARMFDAGHCNDYEQLSAVLTEPI